MFSLGDAGDGSAVCTLFYTGGTTGNPKMVTHRSHLYDGVAAIAASRRWTSPDPRTLICTLLTHVSGHTISLAGILAGEAYSRLLDDFLCALPGIAQAAAVGVPDARYGEAVHVFLVPDRGSDPDVGEVRRRVGRGHSTPAPGPLLNGSLLMTGRTEQGNGKGKSTCSVR